MKTLSIDLPDALAAEVEAALADNGFADSQALAREAIRRYLDSHAAEIQDRFIREEPGVSVGISGMFTDLLVTRYGVNSTPELAFDIEVLVEIGDALLHRAFRYDTQGDERYIARLREIVRDFIVSHDAA